MRPSTYQPSCPGGCGRRRNGSGKRGSSTSSHTAIASANVASPIQSGPRPRTRGGSGRRWTRARSELEVEEGTGGGAADDEEQREHQAREHGAQHGGAWEQALFLELAREVDEGDREQEHEVAL